MDHMRVREDGPQDQSKDGARHLKSLPSDIF